MKRDKFFDIAEKMYVEQFITEEEIARRIGVCDRTIRRWKALGDWGIKRDGFLKANTISKDAMYARKQSYTKEEFLRIIKQVVDMDEEMDLDFQNMMKKDGFI